MTDSKSKAVPWHKLTHSLSPSSGLTYKLPSIHTLCAWHNSSPQSGLRGVYHIEINNNHHQLTLLLTIYTQSIREMEMWWATEQLELICWHTHSVFWSWTHFLELLGVRNWKMHVDQYTAFVFTGVKDCCRGSKFLHTPPAISFIIFGLRN